MTSMTAHSPVDTGTRDVVYDLISVAYHLLQGAENLGMYLEDAQHDGNDELTRFFRETKEEYMKRAAKAKELLIRHVE